jgi:hypothetical protein
LIVLNNFIIECFWLFYRKLLLFIFKLGHVHFLPDQLSRINHGELTIKVEDQLRDVQLSLWEKRVFAIGLAMQFWNCIKHFQLVVFICCGCYQTSCKSHNSLYMVQLITIQLQLYRNNFFSITMQLTYDYNHNVMLMSIFIHPSKFNTWHYEKNYDLKNILISIVHHDYSFSMVLDYDTWHNQKLPHGILLNFGNKYIDIYVLR